VTPARLAERAGLLRDCCERPADDVPRLILADWMEENGEAERGEFIRVQIGLASCAWAGTGAACPQCEALRLREAALLIQSGPDKLCNWFAWAKPLQPFQHGAVTYLRGLVAKIALPLAVFMAHAREIFATCPIEAEGVRLTGREPDASGSGVVGWFRRAARSDRQEDADDIPEALWHRLRGETGVNGGWKLYESTAGAQVALSRAAVAWARGEVGLPALGD
jgi:uncharacterized protein (TIGR02996 family)